MQVVPLGPRRVKLSEINNFKKNWKHVQPKASNKREVKKVTIKFRNIIGRGEKSRHIASSQMNLLLL